MWWNLAVSHRTLVLGTSSSNSIINQSNSQPLPYRLSSLGLWHSMDMYMGWYLPTHMVSLVKRPQFEILLESDYDLKAPACAGCLFAAWWRGGDIAGRWKESMCLQQCCHCLLEDSRVFLSYCINFIPLNASSNIPFYAVHAFSHPWLHKWFSIIYRAVA